jgi:protein-disulfide isomerase
MVMTIAAIVSVTILLLAGCASAPKTASWTDVPGVNRPAPQVYPMQHDNAIGNPKAPVRIDEYSDFQCPYCKRFAQQTEPQIIDEYVRTGKVYFVYHSMGNFLSARAATPNTESEDAAMAAYAAGAQNRFWQYHDVLFANQFGINSGDFSPATLKMYARALGLDMKKFNADLDSGKYRSRVNQDQVEGASKGVAGTPTLFVNGEEIVGAEPFAVYQKAINKALAAAGVSGP